MEGQAEPVAELIDTNSPQDNLFLRYSLDLYNYKYFWEGHVYLEALWNAHQRKGSIADFLKALIKIDAAGVKVSIQQLPAAIEHLHRAQELLSAVAASEGFHFLGFDLNKISQDLQTSVKDDAGFFPILPEWE